MSSLSDKEMQDILNSIMLNTTEQMANIEIKNEGNSLSPDICTVNTSFDGNCKATISLFADKSFLLRLTQEIFHNKDVTKQDIEDAAKEYLNVICGRLINKVFPLIHRPTTFNIPAFQIGKQDLEHDSQNHCELYYVNNYNESILLVFEFSIFINDNKKYN